MMRIRKENGFTFIEMILTIIVVGIISGVTAKVLMSGLDTYSFITNRKDASQHARVAMERMVNEVTLMRWYDITYMGNDRLSFFDRDGVTCSFKRYVTEDILNLRRGDDFLAGPLGLIDFDYLRADGSAASYNSQIKKVNIELAIQAIGGHGLVSLRTEVFPRNMMYTNFQR